LTRDHVARCIVREVREGRGSPHGGVFLDIAWIKEKIANSEAHIKKKLPSMYHQFKELAGLDITKEPMEVGPTTHYVMGGVRVDGDTQMSTVPGLFAAGECAAGLHGANRLGGNSLSDLLVFGKRAGEYASKFAKEHSNGSIDQSQIDDAAAWALGFFEHKGDENAFMVQAELQQDMQDLAGIVRNEDELTEVIEKLKTYNERAKSVVVTGNRAFNPGWHNAMDLRHMLIVSEASAIAARERRESRGAQFREDHKGKDEKLGKTMHVIRKGRDGSMQLKAETLPERPADLQQIIEDNK
jgi:succinate dehydrogenase / fumarate reductase flavoprotein subunit